jgi:hypothetical protein
VRQHRVSARRFTTRPGKNPGQAGALEEHQDPGKNIRDDRSSQAGRTVSAGSRPARREILKVPWPGRLPLLTCRGSPLRGVHPELRRGPPGGFAKPPTKDVGQTRPLGACLPDL